VYAPGLDKITDADIAKAAANPDQNAALADLQDIAQIESGDVAAQVFSDMDEDEWRSASVAEREEKVRDWLRIELSYAVSDGEMENDREQEREEMADKIARRNANIDWDDPASRAALIERVGPDHYARLQAEHHKRQTVANVKGHGIRTINSRFGRLFMVEGTDRAFSTLAEAETFARSL